MRAVIALVVCLIASPAWAGGEDAVDSRVHGLAGSLMSPFCPGKTLQSCTSQGASMWLDEIRGWVADGLSDDEIERRLQARVPDFDLSHDPGGSANWLLFAIPIAGTSVLLLWGSARLRRRQRLAATETAGDDDDEIDPDLLAELEEELAELD